MYAGTDVFPIWTRLFDDECGNGKLTLFFRIDLFLRQGHLQFFNKEILPLIQSRTSQARWVTAHRCSTPSWRVPPAEND